MRLIDADAMKERLGMAHECDDCDDPRACRYDSIYTKRDFCLCIDDEPTVEERKTGRWIWDDEGYHCSECFFHAYGDTLNCLDGTFKYCPHCGAKMEGVNGDE